MPVIIDGYNLLRSLEKIGEEFDGLTDVRMCRIIQAYLLRIHDTGQIVFDGIGPPDKSPFSNMSPLEVIFSGADREADCVIEDKITANTAPKRLAVVSNDRRLVSAAKKRKAASVKTVGFWAEVISVLEKKKSASLPKEKHRGIGEMETRHWLKEFGFDKK